MGQEQSRNGQGSRIEGQLDRIESNTKLITEMMPGVRDRPPPLPSKDLDDSPPPSPSSTASTARPVTPPPYMSADSVQRQFDDIRNMLGSLIGRTNDIADEVARRREYEVELPPRPELSRIENLLKRTLSRLGGPDMDDHVPGHSNAPMDTPMTEKPPTSTRTRTGSLYDGSNAIYSDELGSNVKAPANSFVEVYDPKLRRWSSVPSSLLDGYAPEPEFDADFAISNLPPDTPPQEYSLNPVRVPDFIRDRLPRKGDVPPPRPLQHDYAQTEYDASPVQQQAPLPSTKASSTAPPSPREEPDDPTQDMHDLPPIPYRTEQIPEDQQSYWSEDDNDRGPVRQAPPPAPVDLPTPVRSPGQIPQNGFSNGQMGYGPGMRPPMSGPGMMGPGMPPPPGMNGMGRPALPRIAGVRDPISTT